MFQLRLLLALFLALAPLVSSGGGGFFAGAAQAQTTTDVVTIDYEAWEEAASSAEALIDGSVASTSMLEARRAELSEWRARFLEADARNEERIATIRSQIEALGAAPEEGETEPDTIAARRATLAEALREAQAPSLRASEAFNRANGLIAEIDAIVVERQTEELLELAPTPLNPVKIAPAATAPPS